MTYYDVDKGLIYMKSQVKKLTKTIYLVNVQGNVYILVERLARNRKLMYVRPYNPIKQFKEVLKNEIARNTTTA